MGRHICIRCACGEADFAASASFTAVVWDDVLGALEAAGIENPYRYAPDGHEVDGAELQRWWEDVLDQVGAARDRLATLYQVWLEQQGPHGPLSGSDAAYFVWRGAVHMAEGVYDTLEAVPLPRETWEERRSRVPYEPPVAEEAAPEAAEKLGIAPGIGGRPAVRLTADAFERIFRGTPVTLEHGNLLDFFARELAGLREAARHAAERGERVSLFAC